MKQVALFITLLTLALADKPDPVYKTPAQAKSVKSKEKVDKAQSRQDQYGAPSAPAQDTYGSPAAPAQDSYGSPAAPAKDSYGSPSAPVQEAYGSPKADPVAPPAQGSVGTQGYYYYYYPVASSSSGGSYAGNKHGSSSSSSGGLLSGGGGGLLIPLVLGIGLLILLAVAAAALFRNNGRSFLDGQSILAAMAPYADELTVSVFDALKVYADLNQVAKER